MVDPRFEEVSILVVRKASSWESVPQSSDSWEKTVRMELCFLPMEYKHYEDGSPPV